MPWSKDTALRRAVEDYQKGMKVPFLAARYHVNEQAIRAALKKAGVKTRPRGADKRSVYDQKSAIQDYLSGDSILALSAKYGVQRCTLVNRFTEAGVKLRSASEQAFISAARQSPEERLARATAAHNAVRGSKRSLPVAIKMAINRQIAGNMTPKEASWRQHLADAGIPTVPQYAVGKYSIDLAVPHVRLAIECRAGWSKHGARGASELIREKFLKERGWLVLDLWGAEWRPGWADKVKLYLEQREVSAVRN